MSEPYQADMEYYEALSKAEHELEQAKAQLAKRELVMEAVGKVLGILSETPPCNYLRYPDLYSPAECDALLELLRKDLVKLWMAYGELNLRDRLEKADG